MSPRSGRSIPPDLPKTSAAFPVCCGRGREELRNQVIEDYASYIRSFVEIRDARIRDLVERELSAGFLWPQPLVQLNPAFEPGETFDQLIADGTLHPENRRIFARRTRRAA